MELFFWVNYLATIFSLCESCTVLGIAMHEILHALGQAHEQSRPDRDAYVTIKWQNACISCSFRLKRISEPSDVLNDTPVILSPG